MNAQYGQHGASRSGYNGRRARRLARLKALLGLRITPLRLMSQGRMTSHRFSRRTMTRRPALRSLIHETRPYRIQHGLVLGLSKCRSQRHLSSLTHSIKPRSRWHLLNFHHYPRPCTGQPVSCPQHPSLDMTTLHKQFATDPSIRALSSSQIPGVPFLCPQILTTCRLTLL